MCIHFLIIFEIYFHIKLMFENFSCYLQDKARFTTSEINQIKAVSHVIKLEQDQTLVQEGTIWPQNAFVCSGLLRSFIIDDYGNEQTVNFAPRNYWVGDRASLLTGKPIAFSVDAIQESHVILIEQSDFHYLSKTIDTFNTMMSSMIQKNIEVSQKLVNENLRLNEKEKYLKFLEKYDAVESHIPIDMIASYIGTTPDVLLRIKDSVSK
jgi:CRP-like cAMP-binding protein